MARIKRRRRVGCRLKCEIAAPNGSRVRGRVISISEGGLAVVAELSLDQGEPIVLMLAPGRGRKPIRISAIVWYDESASPSGRRSRIRHLGCVVSQPPRAFLALLDELAPEPSAPSTSRRNAVPVAKSRRVDPERVEPDLPRSRELQPPPKAEPDESLPYFRIRLKQIGGPRTRILTLRARSATQAERLALDELERVCSDAEGWGVLHIARVTK